MKNISDLNVGPIWCNRQLKQAHGASAYKRNVKIFSATVRVNGVRMKGLGKKWVQQ